MKGKLIIVGTILIGGGILLFPDTIEQIDIPSWAHATFDNAENLQNDPSVQNNFNSIIEIFYEKLDVLKSLFISAITLSAFSSKSSISSPKTSATK